MIFLNKQEGAYCQMNGIDPAEYLRNTAPADREKIKAGMNKLKFNQKKLEQEELYNLGVSKYPDWVQKGGFSFTPKGEIIANYTNYMNLLLKCPELQGAFSYDKYTQRYLYQSEDFSPQLILEYQTWYENYYKVCNPSLCLDALKTAAIKFSFNRATQIFDNLIWDGVSRLETVFIDLLGADDTPLVREMSKRWLVGAIKRIYEPGCKNENVLILTGPQGCGKTSTLQWLAGELGFENNINISAREQETGQKLEMCWFCCFDELASLTKKESAEYKNWLSIQYDNFRVPYERLPQKKARHNAYCGTTNETSFLKDHTDRGERRMWVIKCNRTAEEWTTKYHDKLTQDLWENIWAEAVHVYKTEPNFKPYLDASMFEDLIQHQNQFKDYNSDNLPDMLDEILNRKYLLDKKTGRFILGYDDMIRQIKQGYTYRAPEKSEHVGYINHIPRGAINRILNDVLHSGKIRHNYMRNALDGRWCVKEKQSYENGIKDRYYIRGRWIDREMEVIEREIRTVTDKDIMHQSQSEDVLELTGWDMRKHVCVN